ncbi:hypothetical protein [Paenarthrobacter ureafaciens]|uniref:hypothetical protein n=1 Tax=Paenarthrobacter ureafaciens TaxID=37931 RepID=UPI00217529B3|nr:hypothetical protein [Paenarthrobacter ureafaciens]
MSIDTVVFGRLIAKKPSELIFDGKACVGQAFTADFGTRFTAHHGSILPHCKPDVTFRRVQRELSFSAVPDA